MPDPKISYLDGGTYSYSVCLFSLCKVNFTKSAMPSKANM